MKNTNKGKHLTLSQRITIQQGLDNGDSFTEIGKRIGKDPSTVSKEVKNHIQFKVRTEMGRKIPCKHKRYCKIERLCDDVLCTGSCKICRIPGRDCKNICPEYEPKECEILKKPPHVCNACSKKQHCVLERRYYAAKYADAEYREVLVTSREGINQSPVDIAMLDQLISPLLKKGQSLSHIYANHGNEIACCRKTLYNYIDKGVLTAGNLDLRRRVRYKVRRKPTQVSIAFREFRRNRSYDDFKLFQRSNPNINVVEMDTVIGKKTDSQVFLTMLFRNCSLMLIFLLPEKTQDAVADVFDRLTNLLGIEIFRELFPVILTDNGTEFQDPLRLECDENGEVRTQIYYCNPNSAWQKGMIERNHEFIRLVIPKGKSLEMLTENDALVLMNNINSEARDSLNGCNPYKLSLLLLNNKLHEVLNLQEIAADDVTLCPALLK